MPPVWAVAGMAVAWLLSRLLPVWRFDAGPLGAIIMAAGFALIVWSAVWFWRKKTPIEPRHTPSALIVEGPYRLNRNPIYTGMALILAGWSLWLGALSAALPAALFPAVIARRFIVGEEEALRAAFGAAADSYLSRTRRW